MATYLPQPFIDLQKGWPTPRLLPVKALQAATNTVLSSPSGAHEALLYGLSEGDLEIRKAVAAWLSRLYRLQLLPPFSVSETQYNGSAGQSQMDVQPVAISPDRICITNGASGNLAAILATFTDPVFTRRIWMVEPTYFLACPAFEDAGFQGRMEGIPEDDSGLNVEFLRQQIEAVDGTFSLPATNGLPTSADNAFKSPARHAKLYRHVIYLVPTFSNPSAKTYTIERRVALVRLAREVDALIITDDCYDFLSWTNERTHLNGTNGDSHILSMQDSPPPPPRLVDIDNSLPGGDRTWGNAVSNGSFSKVLGPGLRCGWAEATPSFIQRLSLVAPNLSGGCQSQFTSTLIEQILSTGALESHLQKVLIPTYKSRSIALRHAIEQHLVPLGVEVSTGQPYMLNGNVQPRNEAERELSGGFFLYITFPKGVNADEVAATAFEEYNVKILPPKAMAVRRKSNSESGNNDRSLLDRGVRLCWAWEEEETLVKGIERLALVLQERFS